MTSTIYSTYEVRVNPWDGNAYVLQSIDSDSATELWNCQCHIVDTNGNHSDVISLKEWLRWIVAI